MYGTVAHMHAKPGMEQELTELFREYEHTPVAGSVAVYVYQMDSDPTEFALSVVFESKEAYFANANNPEQNTRYEKMVKLLAGEPQWNDGAIVHSMT